MAADSPQRCVVQVVMTTDERALLDWVAVREGRTRSWTARRLLTTAMRRRAREVHDREPATVRQRAPSLASNGA